MEQVTDQIEEKINEQHIMRVIGGFDAVGGIFELI